MKGFMTRNQGLPPLPLSSEYNMGLLPVGTKRYLALVSQSGVAAPTATVIQNTLGGALVWTRDNAGLYSGTLAGAFPSNKVVVASGELNFVNFDATTPANSDWNRVFRASANVISIENRINNALADVFSFWVDIIVLP